MVDKGVNMNGIYDLVSQLLLDNNVSMNSDYNALTTHRFVDYDIKISIQGKKDGDDAVIQIIGTSHRRKDLVKEMCKR